MAGVVLVVILVVVVLCFICMVCQCAHTTDESSPAENGKRKEHEVEVSVGCFGDGGGCGGCGEVETFFKDEPRGIAVFLRRCSFGISIRRKAALGISTSKRGAR
ncbi:hypothetical protein QVD17_05543 [Tagetes erecta]|uniref:Secreted protein n=1 Tax=Tagetes erecta TaxID=13708 RepID=A0AAD8LEK0_TARER|nr:hypothetical protein QVD17_05543 [Tagetes erecta]